MKKLILFLACSFFMFQYTSADAAQINKVYRGMANFDVDDVINSVDIGGNVDQTKTIVLMNWSVAQSWNGASVRDQNVFFTVQFEDNGTLTIARGGATVPAQVSWQVVEFNYGVNVQRGISSLANNATTKSITLPTTLSDSTKAIPVVHTNSSYTGQTLTDMFYVIPTFPDANTLTLTRRNSSNSFKNLAVTWQVIEFTKDVGVQTGSKNLAKAVASGTVTLGTGLNNGGSTALLFFYINPGQAMIGEDNSFTSTGEITNYNTLTFARKYAPNTNNFDIDYRYYVADFREDNNTAHSVGFGQNGSITGQHVNGTTAGGTPVIQTITSITDATPAVVTLNAHGYNNGQWVNIDSLLTQTNVLGNWVVANKTANTFELQGTVTAGLGVASGTMYVMPAVETTLSNSASVTTDRTVLNTSVISTENNTTQSRIDDLSVASYLKSSTAISTLRAATARTTVTLGADLKYNLFEFPSMTLTYPNGGESMTVGTIYDFTWKSSLGVAADNWKLQMSTAPFSSVNISSSTNASPIQITTATNHNVVTGDVVTISGHATNTAANGTWVITKVGNTTFTLDGSVGNGVGGATGTMTGDGTFTDMGSVCGAGGNAACTHVTAALSAGTIKVKIPDNIGTTVKFRMVDTTDTAYLLRRSDTTNQVLTIKRGITITSPIGAESWTVGDTSRKITWDYTGQTSWGNVKIEYSKAGNFSDTVTLTSSATVGGATGDTPPYTGKGEYAWNPIPDIITSGATAKVRVSSNTDATVTSTSPAAFTVKRSLTLTQPGMTVGETLVAQTPWDIKWNYTGQTGWGTVKVQISTDPAHSTWSDIATGVAVGGASGDTPPYTGKGAYSATNISTTAVGTTVKVRVVSETDGTIIATSSNDFTVVAKISVTYPNGGETLYVDNTANITWNTSGSLGALDTVRVDFSRNGAFSDTVVVCASCPANNVTGTSGQYVNWAIPDAIQTSATAKVKVTSLDNGVISDSSDSGFQVKGIIDTLSPNGGEVYDYGSTIGISWNFHGNYNTNYSGQQLEIRLSSNGGSSYPTVLQTVSLGAGGIGSWSWATGTQATATNYRIQLALVSDPSTVFVSSAANFRIKTVVTVTSPNGGETWHVGDTAQNITWTKSPASAGDVDLYYSTNSGGAWTLIQSAVSGTTYNWNPIPSGALTTAQTARVKVQLNADSTVSDASNSDYKVEGVLVLGSPDTAVTWYVNDSNNITWTSTPASQGNVALTYSTNGGSTYPNAIATVASNSSPYAWTIPDAIGTQVRVKVAAVNDGAVLDASSVDFTIKPKFIMTSPNSGSESWVVGESRNITWTTFGTVSNVNLLKSSNSGGAWSTLASNLSNLGTYDWASSGGVADSIGTANRVKVESTTDSTANDDSNADYTIKGSVTVTSPNLVTDVLTVGSGVSITWTKTGSLNNLKILYSTDGGSTYPDPANLIASGVTPGDLNYSWTVPDAIGTNVKVKIVETGSAPHDALDESNQAFPIKGSLILTAPNGSENYFVGQNHPITWTKTGTLGNVKLVYSTDGGATYPEPDNVIASGVAASALSYAWNPVADAIDTDIRVKVILESDSAVADASNGNFSIKGYLNLTAPVGGETWEVGSVHAITWTRDGASMGNIKLEYSTDGGSTYPNLIVTGVASSALSYNWTIPDVNDTDIRVKITLLSDATTTDECPANFTIRPKLTITSPNGSETWIVNEARNITWTTSGTVSTVNLHYSTNGGSTFANLIASAYANSNTYAWTVPDAIDNDIQVRVQSTNDPTTILDVSNGNFTIKGNVAITSPNGSETLIVGATHLITWTHNGSLGTVKVLYSTDGGVTYPDPANLLASVPVSNLNYSWTVPDAIGGNLKVKVTQTGAAPNDAYDESNAAFAIKGSLIITAPNGAENFYVGQPHNITWTKTGTLGNIKLVYSTDGGSTYPEPDNVIIGSVAASDLTYSWTVADAIDTDIRVKAILLSDSAVNDASNANFSIKGYLHLTSPVGSEVWEVDSIHAITWTRDGASMGDIRLEYSTDGGSTYPTLIANNIPSASLTYNWTIPDVADTDIRVKLTLIADPSTTDASPANFTLRPKLALTSPNGSETWIVNESKNITWTTNGTVATVNLHYSTNGGSTYANVIQTAYANTNTYAWTVPDAIDNDIRVRVQSVADPTNVADSSNADFTIKGSATVTSPNGAETLIVGATHLITWTHNGSLGSVKVLYSTDGGVTYPDPAQLIATVPVSDLNYSWTVPDTIGGNLKVKVTQTGSAPNDASDESNAAFAIKGSLTITAPNGTENFYVGQVHAITWTKTGTLGNIKLVYSTDGGATYPEPDNVIVGSVAASALTYNWTVADAIDTDIRVKAILLADTAVNDASNANFSIKGYLNLSRPLGGQTFEVGTTEAINWTRNGASMGDIKIEYSKDSGATYSTQIATGVASSALTYNWTVPDDIDNEVRVKVTLLADASTTSASSSDLAIKAKFIVTSPNGSETWVVNESHDITWTTGGTVATVNLHYSTDGGATYANSIAAAYSNTGTYDWTVPDAIDNDIKVRVQSVADTSVSDASNAVFTIKGNVTLTSPNLNSDLLIVGGSHLITWTKNGSLGNVKLLYSTDGGVTYPDPANLIATVSSAGLNYNWTNIPDAIGSNVKVKIIQASGVAPNDAEDESNQAFSIKGSLTVVQPNGTEVLTVASSYSIQWTKTGTLGNVKLVYSTDGGVTYPEPDNVIIASTAASDLSYSWTVPDAIDPDVRVKIILLSDTAINDQSNANFFIKGSLTLTQPNTAVSWPVGGSRTITWTRVGSIANVKLEYSINSGSSFDNLIVGSTSAAALSYGWTLPDAVSDTVRVRVSDASDASIYDDSNIDFAIKPSITLTAPNGGEAWIVGTAYDVTWTKNGTIANVKIDYSTDGGSTFPNAIIASTGAGSLSYTWVAADSITNAAVVRISKVGDATVYDDSDAYFRIKGSLTLTSPNGLDIWGIGDHHDITWTKTGTVGNVKLEYSTNAGSSYPNVITASVDSAAGTPYDWTIPDNPSSQVRVKVTSTTDATVYDESNANLSIVGTLTLTAPNGAEVWIVGASNNITWTKTGNLATVKLEYSTNGGTTYPNSIATGVSASALSYAWTVPDAIGSTLRVKITDEGDANVVDSSAANFQIKGSLTMTAPNGSEIWLVGASQNITWTKTGTLGNVKLEYSTNSGSTYPNTIIASTPSADLSYAWTVSDAIGATLRVKITSTTDSSVNDASNADFTVRGQVTLTAPNGSEAWIVGSSENITWSRVGTFANVKLEYSTDGGSSYPNTIIASTPTAAGTYAWTVADAISSQVRVRVSDANDPAVIDGSNANFTIKGSLTLTAPNGGQAWAVASSQNVTWSKTGTFANVKLELSTDGGSTYPITIVGSTSATLGTYAWTVPDNIGTQAKVKISNLTDTSVNDASDNNFKIIGVLSLTAPDGGEGWGVNTPQSITWALTGSIANVRLEYSINGGSSYPNQITASTPAGALSYSWTIPDNLTTTARVRISDATDATVNDASTANFKIQAIFTLTAPNGGEVWTVDGSQDITWGTVGSAANVRLEYSTDGGSSYATDIAASTSNTGTYSWTIPDDISATVRVRVSDVNDASAMDASAANFKIRGNLLLTSPNGAESWDVASAHAITWTRTGSIATVKLEYSSNSGSTFPNLITASTSASAETYAWTVPDAISQTLRVRVTDTSDATVLDSSNADFTIKGAFTLTAPNGAEQWVVGTGQNITWTRFGTILNAELRYSTNGGSSYTNVITASTDASTGSYSWTIPDALSTTVRVKITDTGNANVFDTSNADFTIKGSLTLNSPNGGENWIVGESRNITWSRTGSILNVKLDYSTNSGSTYPNSIVGATDATTGTYAWTVPDAISTLLRVKVTDTTNNTVTDGSNGDFTVRGSLAVTAPNGGEVWIVGASENITWSRNGTISTVKLDYSTNGGSTFPNAITASTSGLTGTYAWTIPDSIGTSVRVRIADTSDPTVLDDSDADFTVRGSVIVTSPNGSEAWVVNSNHNVTWTKTGTFANVKIEYSINGGGAYPNTITASTNAATGSYAWTIPDDIQSAVRVKVTSLSDANVNDASDTNLKIVGAFVLTAPNGTEQWKAGANNNITWTRTGTISNAKLEYSINSGSTYPTTIIASTPAGALSYTWSVPDDLTTTARVRISDASDATVFDTSNGNFEIQASFTITAPDGGEVWTVNSAQDITWGRVGSTANVAIDYSTDGGGTYPNSITASAANTGSFSWTVPNAISAAVRVRVSDANNANAYDVSNANFKIRGSLTVTSPNGSEAWVVASSQNITWTRVGSVSTVKLEYSTDSGSTFPNLINGAVDGSLLTYSWTIPDALTANARLRVTDASDPTVYDDSNANFRIAGSLTLTAPNGSETWTVASSRNITWTRVGTVDTVKLEYSTDGGGSYPNMIIASVQASDLSFPWSIPDSISTQVRVKITDTSYSGANDVSNANFKIAGVLTLTSPDGGEVWDVISSHAITWTKQGTISNVKLEYSTNSGSTYPNTIIGSVSGAALTYNWTIPDSISSTLRVKITNLSDSTVNDTSAADFKIAGVLTLTSPDGGEVWSVGASEAISWSRVGSVANAKLDYSIDGGVNYTNAIIASTSASTLSYSWTIPDNISATVKVKISDAADPTVFDVSNANFKIRGSFTLTAPNGTEGWVIGSSHNVTWTKNGTIANAKLEYSKDSGATFPFTIIGSVAASGLSYTWIIPDDASTQVRVRISQVGDGTIFDNSDANFTIRAGFTVTSPTGGEQWAVGSSHDINWVTGGTIPNVKLEYSSNGGNSYTTIIASTNNNQTYAWVVPDAITTQARVKVSDVNDVNASDSSAANFKIHGTFTLTAPNGGEQWLVGTSQSVTWTKTGSIANAKLEYSTNSGSTYPNLIIGSTSASALSYSWTIPDVINSALRIRITDVSDATVSDTSNADFKIKGNFTITSPNGNENWIVASVNNITWGTLGTVANVKLEYGTDGGSTFNNIIASTPNTGTYAWTVPDAITIQARVRISDVLDSTANDMSDANFKIRGGLTITAPNGAEKWNVGTNRLITWDRVGSIANVKLDYSSNNGTIYIPIIASTGNTGAYSWTVPDAITTQGLVRITDVNDNTVSDASNANFKIMGNFTVTSPNGGEVWTVTSAQNVTWTSSGTMTFAKIEYSTNGGSSYPNLVNGSTSNNGLYAWTVPDSVSGTVRIRVSDPNDSDAYDDSNANFRIRMVFAITAPNGGQKWAVGSTQNITWSAVGTIPNVKLQYSRDGFLADINTITAATPSSPYSWTVPDSISSSVRVRISDPNDIGAIDDSNADFKILGGFVVTSPNGTEKWDVASTHDITWTQTGSVPDARIEYSTDGGATYPYTVAATENDGTYSWIVPDTISASFRVRVSDLADAEAYDTSNANAKIRAKFTVTSPDGTEIWTVGDSNNVTWSTVGTVANVKLDYSTDSGSTYPNAITASAVNSGTYAWTIPDAISTLVRVRVMSTTDVDAFDASNADFKIRGKFVVSAPNGSENWRIAQVNNITWATTGTIANVKIYYSMNSGSTYPNVITASTANTGTYAWTIPDTPSPSARVRVENTLDATVYDDSNANFRIQGFFTLTAPNGGEAWVVGTSQNITWTWGGTIPNVKLTYSKDGGSTYANSIIVSTANGVGGAGTHSYSWTIPDDIATAVRVKVEDVNDNTVADASDANFKIVGSFTITAPNGGERWVTNEVRNITWGTSGSVANVKLEYSVDDFVTPVVISASTPNAGTYAWTIPDPGIANVPKASKVRISDVTDLTTYDVSNASFNIDYYNITWEIRDLVTNASLSQLTVNEVKASDPNFSQWSEAGISTNPPRVQPTPYGTWVATWTKAGFGDGVQVVVANSDQSIVLYMETSTVHIWLADSRTSYDPDADTLNVSGWLSRDGSITTGAVASTFKIYDGATLLYTLVDNTVDSAGFFNWTVAAPTGFVAGRTYTTICEVTVGSGGVFKTPSSFQVTDAKKLEEVKDTVNSVLDVPISVVQANIQTTLDAQTQTISTKLDQQTATIQTVLTNFENTISTSIVSLESAASQSLTSAQTLEKTALKFSWKAVVAPNPALTGDTILLQAQGPRALFPYLSVYNNKNKQVIANGLMSEDQSRPGNYSFAFPADAGDFEAGEAYTYVVTEDITGGLVAGSGFIEAISLTSVAGLAAAAPAAEKAAKEAALAIKDLREEMAKGGNVEESMKSLKRAIDNMQSASGNSPERENKVMRERVGAIMDQLKQLAGDTGLNFDELFKKAIDESSTVQEIRSRAGQINQAVDLIGAVVEKRLGGVEEPIVDIQFESVS